jgi:hypothetical protein
MDWNYEALWDKAALFAIRAHEVDSDDPLFPLWATVALETLARASLAKVHPALLADPTEGESLLYVFGFGVEKEARSIPAKTLFTRCQRIVAAFTQKEFLFCMNMMERRNRELHSGAAGFADFPTDTWLYEYYRICSMLLAQQSRTLRDLLPEESAIIAEKMIAQHVEKVQKGVKEIIRLAKDDFYRKTPEEQLALRAMANAEGKKIENLWMKKSPRVKCPSCGTEAMLAGELMRASEPRLEEDSIVRKISILPTLFQCWACGIKLEGYEKLQAATLGGLREVREYNDPAEYFGFTQEEDEPYSND